MTTEIENVCEICKEKEFEPLDHLRNRNLGFQVCKNCGFVNYRITKTDDELADYYRNHGDHRTYSGTKDLVTKLNKLPYHKAFVGEHLNKNKNLSILDFGCSTGYFLNYCKDLGHTDLLGVELNKAHAMVGIKEYGLDIKDYFSPKEIKDRKFDLISLFHVIEHVQNPVEKLKEVVALLKPGGLIYMSNPIWFSDLRDASGMTIDFEGLYIPHHINVFSYDSHDNMLNLCGLEIVNENRDMYGRTLLLKVAEKPKEVEIKKENYREIMKILSAQKEALYFYRKKEDPNDFLARERNLNQAISLFPKFPEPYIALAFSTFKEDWEKQVAILQEGLKHCPHHAEFYLNLAKVFMQQSMFKDAEGCLKQCYAMKPSLASCLFYLGEIAEINEDLESAISYYKMVLQQNPQTTFLAIGTDQETILDRVGICYAKMAKTYKF